MRVCFRLERGSNKSSVAVSHSAAPQQTPLELTIEQAPIMESEQIVADLGRDYFHWYHNILPPTKQSGAAIRDVKLNDQGVRSAWLLVMHGVLQCGGRCGAADAGLLRALILRGLPRHDAAPATSQEWAKRARIAQRAGQYARSAGGWQRGCQLSMLSRRLNSLGECSNVFARVMARVCKSFQT